MEGFFDSLESELQELMGPSDSIPETPSIKIAAPPNISTRHDPSKFERFISKGSDDLMTPNDSIELLQKDLDNTLDMLNLLDAEEEESQEVTVAEIKPINDLYASIYPMRLQENGIIYTPQLDSVLQSASDQIQKLALKVFIHHPQTHAKSLIISQFTTSFFMISHLIAKCAFSWDGFIKNADNTLDSFYALNSKQLGWTLVEITADHLYRPIMHHEYISHIISNWQQHDGNLWLFPFKASELYADFDVLLRGYPKMAGFLTIEIHLTVNQNKIKKRRSMFRSNSRHAKAYRYYCQVAVDGLIIKMDKNKDLKFKWEDFNLYSHEHEISQVLPGYSSDLNKKHEFILVRSGGSGDEERIVCQVEGSEKLRDWQRSINSAMALWTLYENPEWFFDSGEYNDSLSGKQSNSLVKDDLVSLEDDTIIIHATDFVLRRSLVGMMQLIDRKQRKQKKHMKSIKSDPMTHSMPSLKMPKEVAISANESTPNLNRAASNGSTLYSKVDVKLKQKLEAQYPGLQNDGPFIQMPVPPIPTTPSLYEQLDIKKKKRTSLSSGTLYDAIQKHQGDEPYHKI
eukprot:NODE_144_length_17694_cov_0.489741.p4 type:complete len:570 gc:universal NODE_144_length_17694_cov_0.489741:2142-433(-)